MLALRCWVRRYAAMRSIFLPSSGEQLCAALATFVADVAGYLAFFLHLVEGRFQLGVNFETGCSSARSMHWSSFQNLVRKGTGDTTNARASPVLLKGQP
jgi:hypothetical protein